MMVEGEWAGRITGLGNERVEIAMMVTPDGHSRLELSRFAEPAVYLSAQIGTVNQVGMYEQRPTFINNNRVRRANTTCFDGFAEGGLSKHKH